MPKFRKKPVVIEAWPVRELHRAAAQSWSDLPEPVKRAYEAGNVIFANDPLRIEVKTLEGWMTGNADDLLICGVQSELYPCKPDIFAATYDAVEERLAD
ncbi:MAG: hypothetical protein IT328_04545 [Caldilineaceae bacterium]|nr:hypothetical protein [Caldilineaceae bacterium]